MGQAVVRQHDDGGAIVRAFQHFTQHLVDLPIKLRQCRAVFGRERGVKFRMLRIDQAPKHVRIQIETGEIKEEQAGIEFGIRFPACSSFISPVSI